MRQLAITAADLPSTNLTEYFNASFVFIEEALAAKRAVLVHCGAGSSRSATICAAYLMRKRRMSAHAALSALLALRSSVCPNEGFWRQLCAFEKELGLPQPQRSDARKPPVMSEAFGEIACDTVAAGAAGERAAVCIERGQPSGARLFFQRRLLSTDLIVRSAPAMRAEGVALFQP